MAEASTINRAQTAVLIMDYQNDIVSNVEAAIPASWTAPHRCSARHAGRVGR